MKIALETYAKLYIIWTINVHFLEFPKSIITSELNVKNFGEFRQFKCVIINMCTLRNIVHNRIYPHDNWIANGLMGQSNLFHNVVHMPGTFT